MEYADKVIEFANIGAKIFRTDPLQHYRSGLARLAKRPMEPGYIPVDAPAKVVTVSYYPNETELATPEFETARESLAAWGASGGVDDYSQAYRDWVAMLPKIPFYRDFNLPIFEPLDISASEFGWLPLIKLPLPARSKVEDEDIWADRMLLWDRLLLLKPRVIVAQGVLPYEIVTGMCRDKFPCHVILQKIGRVGTRVYHDAEFERVVHQLRDAFKA